MSKHKLDDTGFVVCLPTGLGGSYKRISIISVKIKGIYQTKKDTSYTLTGTATRYDGPDEVMEDRFFDTIDEAKRFIFSRIESNHQEWLEVLEHVEVF